MVVAYHSFFFSLIKELRKYYFPLTSFFKFSANFVYI